LPAAKLHVVYVTPKQRPALADYQARLQRCLMHLQGFYADQMAAHGFGSRSFALDLDEQGSLRVHQLELEQSLEQIEQYSAREITRQAAFKQLGKAGIDPHSNYVLIVCNMPDGISPFAGEASAQGGVAWVCDLAHLDTDNMRSTRTGKFKYGSTMGEDVCVYLGGIAHELGHAFGLRHSSNIGVERQRGIALMGYGSYNYAGKLRGLEQQCMLPRVDALQLLSLPAFRTAAKNAPRLSEQQFRFDELQAKALPQGLMLYGKILINPAAYALSVRLDAAGHDDYESVAASSVLQPDGSFSVAVQHEELSGVFCLRLSLMLVSGQVLQRELFLQVAADGTVDTTPLLNLGTLGDLYDCWQQQQNGKAKASLQRRLQSNELSAERGLQAALQRWQLCLQGGSKPALDPANIDPKLKEVSLVDCISNKIASGWSKPLYDVLPANTQGPQAWFSQGPLQRFIFLHAPGKVQYSLQSSWKSLRARLGLALGANGSVSFEVYADGRKMFTTQKLGPGQSVEVELDLEEVDNLELRALDAGDGNAADWAIIGEPLLLR